MLSGRELFKLPSYPHFFCDLVRFLCMFLLIPSFLEHQLLVLFSLSHLMSVTLVALVIWSLTSLLVAPSLIYQQNLGTLFPLPVLQFVLFTTDFNCMGGGMDNGEVKVENSMI